MQLSRVNNRIFNFISEFGRITEYNSSIGYNFGWWDFTAFLPIRWQYFYYTYPGSLTTPPFIESVTWIVCAEYLSISREQVNFIRLCRSPIKFYHSNHICFLYFQLKYFRSIRNQADEPILNNFRETQPLNDRTVLRSFKIKK